MIFKPWNGDLEPATLIRRRYRFLIDAVLDDGRQITAHCANPGAMEGLIIEGARIWLSKTPGGGQRLNWIWELVEIDKIFVCVNSWTANKLVKLLLEAKVIAGMKRHDIVEQEVKLGKNSRIDFKISNKNKVHFIEVKSLQQAYGDGIGFFPASKTVRSVDHVRNLAKVARAGHRATLLVAVEREDVKLVRISDVHDRLFCNHLRKAVEQGVVVKAILLKPGLNGFFFNGEVKVDLKPGNCSEIASWRLSVKNSSGWQRTNSTLNK